MAAVIIVAIVGCAEDTIPDRALVETYADVIVARETHADSASVEVAVDSALVLRGYEKEAFEQDLRSMARTPAMFKAFYDSVSSELTRRRDSLRAAPSAP